MNLLNGKKALVTGGSVGIGKAIAMAFVKNGADVAIFATNEVRIKETVAELEKSKVNPNQDIQYFLVDVSKKTLVENAVATLLSTWNDLDILVNNAGITRDGFIIKMTEEDWDEVININLKSVFNTCKAVARQMMKAKKGKIINISSVVGIIGSAAQVNYAASKAGMIGFSKSLAKELARKNICVNCIAPGYIQTRMTDTLTEDLKEKILSSIPFNRYGTTEDIAQAALFLASNMSDYITGQVLTVDGGMVM
jgi:3-oxoacyl-[acyl-carrier protein] reductase